MGRSTSTIRCRLALGLAAAFALLAIPAIASAAGAWAPQDSGITDGSMLSSVSFTDASHGWAVGDNGRIVRTVNGGSTWASQPSGIVDGTTLLSVDFADTSHGWAVGGDGTVLSTSNSGSTWTARMSGVTGGTSLNCVKFVDATTGWAVGDNGTVIKTTNAGVTWTGRSSGITDGSSLWGVTFVDATHGWAVGDNGWIISTSDGGATWAPQDSGVVGSALLSVFFTDTKNGWAVGGDGTIIATTDGGATWTPQDSGIVDGSNLSAVAFSDASHGWVAGDAGQILVTGDGGDTWDAQASGAGSSNLFGLAVPDATHAWAVGDYGTIVAFGGAGVSGGPDLTAPTTRLFVTPDPVAGWNDSPVTVELHATDNAGGSGVAGTFYALDGTPQTYTDSFDIVDEGVHTLTYHSVDTSGNVEADKNATIELDLTAPHLSLDAVGSYDGSATITATATDGVSGLGRIELRLDGGPWVAKASLRTSAPGTHTVDARAFDVAGNESDASADFVVVWPTSVSTVTKLNTPASGKVRKTMSITGSVTPAGTPGTVTITKTYLVGRKWKKAGAVTVNLVNGSFSYGFKPTVKATWRFVARYNGATVGATTCLKSTSSTKSVKVK